MIRVVVTKEAPGQASVVLADLKIKRLPDNLSTDPVADYEVDIAVERVGAVGFYHRSIRSFRRLKVNVLGLVQAALDELGDDEMGFGDAEVSPSDLARRQSGVRRSLPGEASDPVDHYRPPFWG